MFCPPSSTGFSIVGDCRPIRFGVDPGDAATVIAPLNKGRQRSRFYCPSASSESRDNGKVKMKARQETIDNDDDGDVASAVAAVTGTCQCLRESTSCGGRAESGRSA